MELLEPELQLMLVLTLNLLGEILTHKTGLRAQEVPDTDLEARLPLVSCASSECRPASQPVEQGGEICEIHSLGSNVSLGLAGCFYLSHTSSMSIQMRRVSSKGCQR